AATPSSAPVRSAVGASLRRDERGPGVIGYGTFSYGYPNMYGMVGAGAAYASVRPGTIGYGQPITIDDHQSSRMVVDPFRLLDCCRDTDGAVVVMVTTTARARDLASRPVCVLGMGTGHNMRNWWTGDVF